MKYFLFWSLVCFAFGCKSNRFRIVSVPYFEKLQKSLDLVTDPSGMDNVEKYYYINKQLGFDDPAESLLDSFVCSHYCLQNDTENRLRYSFTSTKRSERWYENFFNVPTETPTDTDIIRYYSWTILNNKKYGKKLFCEAGINTPTKVEQFVCACDSSKPKTMVYRKLIWPNDYFSLPDLK